MSKLRAALAASQTVTDQMTAAFDMAYLKTVYPDRHDFVASHGVQRDAIVAGIRAALAAQQSKRH